MSANLTREQFCSKSRYLYQIADYLGIHPKTLRIWIKDSEELSLSSHRLYPPVEVRRIVEYFDGKETNNTK
ncbi:MAG: hypothetical protein ACI3Z9_06515 [Candidatus Onthomorpha sp.]